MSCGTSSPPSSSTRPCSWPTPFSWKPRCLFSASAFRLPRRRGGSWSRAAGISSSGAAHRDHPRPRHHGRCARLQSPRRWPSRRARPANARAGLAAGHCFPRPRRGRGQGRGALEVEGRDLVQDVGLERSFAAARREPFLARVPGRLSRSPVSTKSLPSWRSAGAPPDGRGRTADRIP